MLSFIAQNYLLLMSVLCMVAIKLDFPVICLCLCPEYMRKAKKLEKGEIWNPKLVKTKCYLNLHVTLPNPVQSIVPPNFQYQNEKRDAANQSYIFTKFSM